MKTWDSLDPSQFRPLDAETLRTPIIEPPHVKLPKIPQDAEPEGANEKRTK